MKVEVVVKDKKDGSCTVTLDKKIAKKYTEAEMNTLIAVYNAISVTLKNMNK